MTAHQPAFAGSELLAPDTVLPEQLAAPRRDSLISGERALMLAVLEDAIRCYLEPPRGAIRIQREAEHWLWSADETWPFSFVNICDALGIAAGPLRRKLREQTAPGRGACLATGGAAPAERDSPRIRIRLRTGGFGMRPARRRPQPVLAAELSARAALG
ncbi:MAG: hypothetical protein KIT14_22015 [bacterium]|nr:hypothetical protein [bacterium]